MRTARHACHCETIRLFQSSETKSVLNVIILFFHRYDTLTISVPETKERRLPRCNNLIYLPKEKVKKKNVDKKEEEEKKKR